MLVTDKLEKAIQETYEDNGETDADPTATEDD